MQVIRGRQGGCRPAGRSSMLECCGMHLRPFIAIPIALSALALLLAGWRESSARRSAPTLEDARAFFAAQPRFLRPLPHSEVPEGLVDLRAESCGVCHVEIYKEWKVSTHA